MSDEKTMGEESGETVKGVALDGHGVVNLPEQLSTLAKHAMLIYEITRHPRYDGCTEEQKIMVQTSGRYLLLGIALDPKVVTNLEELLASLNA